MTAGIYEIKNKINGKIYVGQSNDIDRRFIEHCSPTRYLTSHIPVEWAIHKYGKNNFEFKILEECHVNELNEKETFWIKKLNTVEKGYNCNEGGDCGTRGERNPNAKLSLEDVLFIRKVYDDRTMSCKECYKLFKDKVKWHSFQGVWEGQCWADVMPEVFTDENKRYYISQASRKKTCLLDDEDVFELRKKYVNHTAKELYTPYKDKVCYSFFQRMLCGLSYTNIPYYHKGNKKWIYPGETPKKNPGRTKNTGIHNCRYSDKEIIDLRIKYSTGLSYKELYETTDKRISLSTFQSLICGKARTDLPYFSKKKQQWIGGNPVTTISASGE